MIEAAACLLHRYHWDRLRPLSLRLRVGNNAADIWLISGNQAAGKTTTGRLLAERFDLAAHVEGDDMQRLIVSGRRWPELEDRDPVTQALRGRADEQYRLRVRNACLLGVSFVVAGITAVVTDIITADILDELIPVLAGRTVRFVMLRPPVEVLRLREVQRLPDGHRERAIASGELVNDFEEDIELAIDRMPHVGLWVDPSNLEPGAVVDLLLRRRDDALWRVPRVDG